MEESEGWNTNACDVLVCVDESVICSRISDFGCQVSDVYRVAIREVVWQIVLHEVVRFVLV